MAQHWRTSRATPGGVRQLPGSPFAQRTQRDLYSIPPLPSGSVLTVDAPFERGQFTQALIDVCTICAWTFFGLLGFTAFCGAFVFFGWLLFFH